MCIYIYIYTYVHYHMYSCMYIHIYIYIERERDIDIVPGFGALHWESTGTLPFRTMASATPRQSSCYYYK